MITDTISLTELLWTVFGLVGLFITVRNLEDVTSIYLLVKDELKRGSDGDWIAIALSSVRQEALRVLIMIVAVGIGVGAMLIPPANQDIPISQLQIIITVGIFLIVAITILQSYLDRQVRDFLRRENDRTA